MSDPKSRRLSAGIRTGDIDVFNSMGDLKAYAPANAEFTLAAVTTAKTGMEAAQLAELKASNALNAARDIATAAEHVFHQKILGVKNQVEAQYGSNSNELQSLGLKKKSEYARPTGKPRSKAVTTA
jgi:hypothetical protein